MRDEHLFTSLDKARRVLFDRVGVVGSEKVPLEAAAGRVLRERVTSDIDCPRSAVSSMDGYCLASEETAGATEADPVSFPVKGRSTPGAEPPRLQPGTCVLITTGAPLAPGADAVAIYEDVAERREGGEVAGITLSGPVPRGSFVRRQAEVVARGDAVLEAGTLVTPQIAGILASFAAGPYEMSRRPRAAVLATGDELAPPGCEPGPYSIRDSNSPALAGMLRDLGCDILRAGRAGDEQDEIARVLDSCGDCDVVMISGGISGGRFDFVPACLERIGAEVIFRGVRMTPGKPALFAARGDTAYFGVPGNPVSAVVSVLMLFGPAIMAMMGRHDCVPVSVEARCAGAVSKKTPYVNFNPAALDARMVATPMRYLGSDDIMSLAGANAFICIPEEVDEVRANEAVRVYPFGFLRQGGEG